MSVITDTSTETIRHDDGGARRRRILRKTASYAILLLFAAFYVSPLLIRHDFVKPGVEFDALTTASVCQQDFGIKPR